MAAVFTDGTAGFYDLTTRSRVDSATDKLAGRIIVANQSADGTRLYVAYQDGRIQTVDTATGQQIGLFQLDGPPNSVHATADGSRVIATTTHDGKWSMTVHDATTGRQLGELPGVDTATLGPHDTLIGSNLVGEITEYDLDTLEPLGTFPGVRGLVSHQHLIDALVQLRSRPLHPTDNGAPRPTARG